MKEERDRELYKRDGTISESTREARWKYIGRFIEEERTFDTDVPFATFISSQDTRCSPYGRKFYMDVSSKEALFAVSIDDQRYSTFVF